MTSFKHVVVGFDDSELAHAALATAAGLAGTGGKLTVVHAYWIPPEIRYYEFFEDLERELVKSGRELLPAAREALADASVDADYVALPGKPAEVLYDVAVERGADEIVVGSRGHGRLALGSVAYRLLGRAPCPVMIVPSPHDDRSAAFRKVAIAIDGSEDADAATAEALRIAADGQAAVTFVVAMPDLAQLMLGIPGHPAGYVDLRVQIEQECDRLLKQAIANAGPDIDADGQLLHGSAGPAIVEHLDSSDYDLLVMGSRGRGGVKSALLGSVSHQVSQRSPIPVLIVGAGQVRP